MKAQEILNKGYTLGHWACDWDPIEKKAQANASVESLIKYKDKYYYVITDYAREKAYEVHKVDKESELKESDFFADMIRETEE